MNLLTAFNVLNNKQEGIYNVYELLKARPLKDIVKDLVALRNIENYSLSKWSEIIGNKELEQLLKNSDISDYNLTKLFLSDRQKKDIDI